MIDKSTSSRVFSFQGPIIVKDPGPAPVVFFDIAPSYSLINGIIGITLVMARQLANGDQIDSEFVATGHLRCSVVAATDLRNAIDKALLLSTKTEAQRIS